MDLSYDKLMQYGLRILSKKRYTSYEMGRKLVGYAKKRGKIDEDDVSKVLVRLAELEYLDDEKFIKDYISDRLRMKPRGRILLKKELKFKGIPEHLIESYFEKIKIDEPEIAFDMLFHRMRRWKKHPLQKQKMKAYQFLYSRGFYGDAIYKAIERCYNRE